MTALHLPIAQYEEQNKNNQDIEVALNNLMIQFRQIDEKYGLMVSSEINGMYHQRVGLIVDSYEFLERSCMEIDQS